MLDPFYAAKQVLDELRITDPSDLQLLDLIAYERQAIVVEEPLEGAEASLVVVGRKAIITVSAHTESRQRKRFSIAHELGHLELHRDIGLFKLCESSDINDWKIQKGRENREEEANEFAAALLLPDRFFGSLCTDEDPSMAYISELATRFDVSLTATAIRYAHFCYEPVAVVFSQEGHIKWFRASRGFEDLELFVAVGSRLDASSRAAVFFDGRSIPSGAKTVHASAWLLPGRYHRETTIQEQSVAMPSYGAVLTLLWVDEDIDDEWE